MNRAGLGLAVGVIVAASGFARADVLDDWTEQWLDTIRVTGGPPCPIARNTALLFSAIYDAVNSIDQTHQPYLGFVQVPGDTNKEAAISAAAHRVLTTLYPARAGIYDTQHADDLAALPNDATRVNGVTVGQAAADAILADRSSDGTDINPTYEFINAVGSYRPTAPDFFEPPFNPGWGDTKPWTMEAGSQFRPKGPLGFRRLDKLVRSRGYARQLAEVQALGERNSPDRTAEQTEVAWFWANDRDGTFKPPGHLMYITQVVANDQGLSLEEKVRLFALVAITLGDAGLVAWDMKYSTDMDLWRPITAIREAETDNNPRTAPTADWLPLLEFTPPFPAYTSGHGTFGAAHAAVMKEYFGTDDISFTVGTDEPIVSAVTRTFDSFTEAARENGLSRVYLGVHFRFDADIAYASGIRLGEHVAANYLQPRGCIADVNGDDRVTPKDLRIYTNLFFAGNLRADVNADSQVTAEDFAMFIDVYFEGCN